MERQDYLIPPAEYLCVVAPRTPLARYLEEARKLLLHYPGILELIRADLDAHALKKKKLRIADKQWEHQAAGILPGAHAQSEQPSTQSLELKIGRPRMAPEVCYYFLAVRGFAGGVKGLDARNLFMESTSIQLLLAEAGVKMPGLSTIIDNTNAISQATRDAILDAQLKLILNEDKDDFRQQIVDSTAVNAHTAWPKDSALIFGFIERIWRRGQKLNQFGVGNMAVSGIEETLSDLKKLDFEISNTQGRKGAKEHRKALYQEVIDLAEYTSQDMSEELKRIKKEAEKKSIKPSLLAKLERLIQWLEKDIEDLDALILACIRRVLEDEPPSSGNRPLSLADPDAAYIEKGGREPVIGYRVQLARTGKGFVCNYLVPKGNANDASQFLPLCEGAIKRTGVTPQLISAVGCYASAKGRDALLRKGVAKVSISSSKGKAITPIEDWESKGYKSARRDRSSVESLVFQLKKLVNLGQMVRCGLDSVKAEITEKILAFNFLRACRL
ncbi:transposase [Acanthopleuribacter pedis]|uniref:Transposase IS4-like domain-containing protein n=1 Tax=Acanthopleuribacter pedis TaxID=442870 RepID=A0A8J7Q0X3_9BACT|nr:transposase [Acanthopleuribacter pedis]MBO1318367.1 hypothetical protein [Acanthopleuribacter pedis]